MHLSTHLIPPAAPAAARAKHVVALVAAVCIGGLAAGVGPAQAAFPGANGRIAFTSDRAGTNDIWTMSPDGGDLVNLTPASPAEDALPSWRADGRRIVFASDRRTRRNPAPPGFDGPDFELFTMNADGSQVRQITFNDADDDDPAWAPDGRRVVFQRDVDPRVGPDHRNWDIFTMRASGTGERNLTGTPATDVEPSWSPNGRRIAFTTVREGGTDKDAEIYTVGIDGTRPRPLTVNETFDGQANWSPNGRKISFQSYREGRLSIFTMRNDGSDQQQLTHDVPDAFGSAWSPNGCIVAFSSFSVGEISTIDVDGGNSRALTDDPSFDFAPDWQPLPRTSH